MDSGETKDALENSSNHNKKNTLFTNHIRFFKNRKSMGSDGISFKDINPGAYFPAISCYGYGKSSRVI